MRLFCVADLHYLSFKQLAILKEVQSSDFDAIIFLGDINKDVLTTLISTYETKPMYGVLGNHDTFQDFKDTPIFNMHNQVVEIDSLKLYGLEGCYKYKNVDAPMHIRAEFVQFLPTLEPVDIIFSHNSPYGIHDSVDISHRGYDDLRDYIDRTSPKVCLHGHQHLYHIQKYKETTIIGVYGGVIYDTETNECQLILDQNDQDTMY